METILLKAISKEPTSRYATAQELADDLRRFLEDKPIRAKRPSLLERTAKWARRHAAIVLAASAVLIIAVGALLASTLLIAREQRQTATALKTAEDRFRQARRAVDTMYTRVAEEWLSQKSDLEPLQRTFLQEALEFYRQLVREQKQTDDPLVRRETARAYNRVAELERRLGRLRDAEAAFQSAIAIQDSLAAEHPTADHQFEAALTWKKLGTLLFLSGHNAEAEEILSRVRSTLEGLAVRQPLQIDVREELAGAIVNLATVWGTVGRREDADNAFRRTLELFQNLAEHDPRNHRYQKGLADCLHGLGTTSTLRGEYPKAHSELERAIRHRRAAALVRPSDGSLKQELADDLSLFGEILGRGLIGEPEQAETALKEAVTLHGELAREFPNVADYAAMKTKDEYRLADLYETLNRYQDAEELLRRTASEYSKLRERYPDRADYRFQEAGLRYNLARMLQNLQRSADSEREIRAAVGLFEQFLKTSPDNLQAQAGLATSLHILGNSLASSLAPQQHPVVPERLAEARRCLERSIETARQVVKTDTKSRVGLGTLRGAHISLSEVLTLSGLYAEARECCMAIVRLYENPGRGGFEALEAVDECLKVVKAAPGLNLLRREEIAQAFVALGKENRRQALSLNSQEFDGAADLVARLVFRLAYRLEPELRDPANSLSLARSLVAREPDSNAAWGALGIASYCSGQIQSAREALMKAIALKNTADDIYMFTSMSLWKSGDRDGARQWYQRAVSQWDEAHATDDWACRLRAEAAALLGVTDHPAATGKKEENPTRPSKP